MKKAKFEGFVDVSLTKEDKSAIKTNLPSPAQVLNQLGHWTERGYKFSLSFDRNGNCHVASLYGQYTASEHPGYCLTCRHTDAHIAIAGLIHIDEVIFEGTWPNSDDTDW